jgi:peptide deformylase
MILEIKTHPDPVLRKKCREVEKITPEIEKLIEDMFETMYANEGVGLTASQVGVLKKVVVVDIGEGRLVFINPKILKKEGEESMEEGCLSVPGVFLKIKRAKKIEVEALNEKGEKFKVVAEGLLARCLQQELDHSKGILILDRVGLWEKIKRKFKI